MKRTHLAPAVPLSLFLSLAFIPSALEAQADLLILGPSVSGGTSSLEAQQAAVLGLTFDIVDATTWSTLTTADFAAYKAIILGDPNCSTSTSPVAAAESTVNVWGPAITGNVVIAGTDPAVHPTGGSTFQGGIALTKNGISFAADEPGKTGAYITLSCYYHFSGSSTPVPLLDAFSPGGFTVIGGSALPGLNDVHIVATHPALAGLTDGDLSNWGNSVHEAFLTWPIDFEVLAIARGTGSFVAADGTEGTPYILARGEALTVISDIDLTPLDAVNPLGTTHTVTATVIEDDVPTVGTTVTFTVIDGPNVETVGSDTTDGSGMATFTYTGSGGGGIDTLHAQFVDSLERTQTSNTVTKQWIEQTFIPGDGNGDGVTDAADLVSILLEINDGDGSDVADVAGGTYPGTPALDVNGDGQVNLQDVAVLVTALFGGD